MILKIPPVTTTVTVDTQQIHVASSGVISKAGQDLFHIAVNSDLSDLQQNITTLLRPRVDRSDRCGDDIKLQNATLAPADPAGLLTATVHYERSVCAKALGKQIAKKLVAGNGVVEVKLTPALEGQDTFKLVPSDVKIVQADGSLGELLNSESLGPTLREKIMESLSKAIQKSINSEVGFPPALQSLITVQKIQFHDAGSGRLGLGISGEAHITEEQLTWLSALLGRQ